MAFANRLDVFNTVLTPLGTLSTLSGKVQTDSTFSAATLTLRMYALSDTTFGSPKLTSTVVADANGDATISLAMGGIAADSYVLRVTCASPSLTLTSGTITVGTAGMIIALLRDTLTAFVGMERFEEPGMPNSNFDTFRFGWGNWTSDGVWVASKDNLDLTAGSGYKVDYANGFIFQVTALNQGHDIQATYKFDLLTYSMLLGYIQRTLAEINGFKPATHFVLESAPDTWLDLLIMGSYYRALEQISMKLAAFKYRRLFDNPTDMISIVESRLQEARTDFKDNLKMIKRRGYAMPLGLSSLQMGGLPYQVDNVNWQNFVIA